MASDRADSTTCGVSLTLFVAALLTTLLCAGLVWIALFLTALGCTSDTSHLASWYPVCKAYERGAYLVLVIIAFGTQVVAGAHALIRKRMMLLIVGLSMSLVLLVAHFLVVPFIY
ncbi:hypothetical protein [Thermoleophilum album]|uniref:Uncharacterized protein n=1 Tax=Thermoleophilum album TaxID=29539 RepID=A0A1H6FRY4_THEAL|nr:hypothetical protein [Thermoleophilum album]SEH12633.1 hypothetical protein SAMN02745716_1156 [Thermoleophilum album]